MGTIREQVRRRLVGAARRPTPSVRTRYHTLFETFERSAKRKRAIMEFGTYTGTTAARLMQIAKCYERTTDIHYFGFDLFEDLDEATFRRELSKKPKMTAVEVAGSLAERTGLSPRQIHLFKGETSRTVWEVIEKLPTMDFIFIDGGHSTGTVANDWRASERVMGEDTVVVFDDYFQFSEGPRVVIDRIDPKRYLVELLEPQDVFDDPHDISPDGTLAIRLAKVTLR